MNAEQFEKLMKQNDELKEYLVSRINEIEKLNHNQLVALCLSLLITHEPHQIITIIKNVKEL